MKIGFDAKRAFCNSTGLGNYSRTLLQNLYQLFPEHSYTLFTPKVKDESFAKLAAANKNMTVVRPNGPLAKTFSSVWRSFFLHNELSKQNIDLYHGLSHELPVYISQLKIKKVVTMHDLIYLRYPEQFPFIDRFVYEKKFRHACVQADKIVAISQQTKQDLEDFFRVSSDRIEIVYQTCHESFHNLLSTEQKSIIREKYDLPQDFVLFVGSLTERKNALQILEAKKILQGKLDFPIVLVGQGKDYKERLQHYINQQGWQKEVLIISNVAFQDLPAVYQLSKLFIYPSLFEGFGIPIIEALHSNVPVISSTGSCLEEAGGPDSQYVSPKDPEELAQAISTILTNSNRSEVMSQKGLKYVQKFSKENVTKKMMELYLSL